MLTATPPPTIERIDNMNKLEILEKALAAIETSEDELRARLVCELRNELEVEICCMPEPRKLQISQLLSRANKFLAKRDRQRPEWSRCFYRFPDGRYAISEGKAIALRYRRDTLPVDIQPCADADSSRFGNLERMLNDAQQSASPNGECAITKNLLTRLRKVDCVEYLNLDGEAFSLALLGQIFSLIGPFSIHSGRGCSSGYFENEFCEGVIAKLRVRNQ